MNLDLFLIDFPWLSGLPEISPDAFTWELNEADNSWLTGVDQGNGTFRFELPGDWVPLGWCDASTIRVRPRSGQIVVLFSDDTREFWQHLMPM